jgi:hypothetical protein
MFCRSPSVIPAYTPGAYDTSRASHLCVSLVAYSASDFTGPAYTPNLGDFNGLESAAYFNHTPNHQLLIADLSCVFNTCPGHNGIEELESPIGVTPRYACEIGHNKQGSQRKHLLDLFSSIYSRGNHTFLDNYSLQERLIFIDRTDNHLF